ncbi:MAG: low molecular weight phosphotyrosine protein phosphatase [Alteromonadaceae bacterium TMED7]|uniref:protein-tyrosine-phosphatase n=1 Tax=Alteromonas alba TaxID=2079529 RepID=A0A2S9VEJ6_9ALTE|nr:low molecular weight protein-tyrosine-phosphatase [Alteromonas alba]MCP4864958.1 low molecular weight phosphotyrosine protein phosphatase [Alteromonas sp.]PRO74880.1 protein-tyrosine-phosphatase [Alteromonas alba]RPH16675.1 MAG: low molecular weight phosphotyrosine protein phosphatase [Alteromonadaceae bacterium TMED7]|tara:strand:- start:6673 stop:7137 length:465 start_codon:yes stop_codon:yes gene_type:complete
MTSPKAVLFVCLGNICRSPTAEAVFRHKADEAGLKLTIDSAGTHGYHTGSPPDKRSQAAGQERGYSFKGLKCRRVSDTDFETFDLILAMDQSNLENLREMSDPEHHHKIRLMLDFAGYENEEVPDPYYGGKKGFELVLGLIEEASDGLIKALRS